MSFGWIEFQTSTEDDRLVDVLDPEFDPKGVAQRLKNQLTHRAKGILVEHGYIDKDYRSTFYNFNAKMGRAYRPDCVRLHFFDGTVWYDEARTDIPCSDFRLQENYFEYIVQRPTVAVTLGQSLLSPDMRLGVRGWAIQSVQHVNLLVHRVLIRAKSGRIERYVTEYKRKGPRNLFMFCEPKGGWRHIKVSERCTEQDFAQQMRWLVDGAYPHAEKVPWC